MPLMPKNEAARKVLDHLPASRQANAGYFGGPGYCIGVPVRSVADVFDLGLAMGAEAVDFGDIGFDTIGRQQYLVFRSAVVAQGVAVTAADRL